MAQRINLLVERHWCCGIECSIVRCNQRLDGQFRCTYCRRKYSIRSGSFFDSFRRVPLVILTRLVFYYFAQGIGARRATRNIVRLGIRISRWTTFRIYEAVCESIQAYMEREIYSDVLGNIVEMDEALFIHRAGPGWRGLRQIWAAGLVERRTGNALVFIFPNRNHATINRIIRQNVMEGSTIVTDGWQSHSRIPRQYMHINVNNNPRYTTSQVESLWGQLRSYVRNMYSGGVVEGNVNAILIESLWRRNMNNQEEDITESLIYIIRNYS